QAQRSLRRGCPMRRPSRPPIGIPPIEPPPVRIPPNPPPPDRQPPRRPPGRMWEPRHTRNAEKRFREQFLLALPPGIRQRAAEAIAAVPLGSGTDALVRAVLAAVTPQEAEELRCVW